MAKKKTGNGWNATTTTIKQYNKNKRDYHCWCIDPDTGKIYDYPTSTLKKLSLYGTNKLVYKPFAKKLQKIVLRDHLPSCLSSIVPDSIVNMGGFCSIKAYRTKLKNRKLKIVFGSLGFKQKDGNIFYEWG